MKDSPGATGSWVTPGTPSNSFSSLTPCQWTAVGRSMWFVNRTMISAPCETRMRGPGYCPLKPYIVKVRIPIVRRTNPASRRSVSPSAISTTSRKTASGSMAGSWPGSGRYGVTPGTAPIRPGSIIGIGIGCGGMRHTAPMLSVAIMWPACSCPDAGAAVSPMNVGRAAATARVRTVFDRRSGGLSSRAGSSWPRRVRARPSCGAGRRAKGR